MTTLNARTTALLLIDVQERINGVMVDQSHLPRQEVLLEGFGVLDLPAHEALALAHYVASLIRPDAQARLTQLHTTFSPQRVDGLPSADRR